MCGCVFQSITIADQCCSIQKQVWNLIRNAVKWTHQGASLQDLFSLGKETFPRWCADFSIFNYKPVLDRCDKDIMDYKLILYNVDEQGIARITFNDPQRLNPLSWAMYAEIDNALVAAEKDNQVKVIVLKGAGRCFSTGGDLGAGHRAGDEPKESGVTRGGAASGTAGRTPRVRRNMPSVSGTCGSRSSARFTATASARPPNWRWSPISSPSPKTASGGIQ